MSDLANTPVYPVECCVTDSAGIRGLQTGPSSAWLTGINLRQHYAGLAMQGYCANPHDSVNNKSFQELAVWSVKQADALIAALDQSQTAKE